MSVYTPADLYDFRVDVYGDNPITPVAVDYLTSASADELVADTQRLIAANRGRYAEVFTFSSRTGEPQSYGTIEAVA